MDPNIHGYYSRRFLYKFFSRKMVILNVVVFLLLAVAVPLTYRFAFVNSQEKSYPGLAGPAVASVQALLTLYFYIKYRKLRRRESIPGFSRYPTRVLAEYHAVPQDLPMEPIQEESEQSDVSSRRLEDFEASASGYSSLGSLKESHSLGSLKESQSLGSAESYYSSMGARPKLVTRATSTSGLSGFGRYPSDQSFKFTELLLPGTRLMRWFKRSKDQVWQHFVSKLPPAVVVPSPPPTLELHSPPPSPEASREGQPSYILLDETHYFEGGHVHMQRGQRRALPQEKPATEKSSLSYWGAYGDPNKEWY